MSEATGCEARTLHRLLEYVPGEGFKRNADDPLLYDMIIVDEASMVDVPLLHALLAAIPAGTRLIMVGDSDQLPSVGPGDALRDIIASGVVRVVRLTEIFRQAQQSLIVTNAHRINAGRMPLLDNGAQSDFRFEEYQSQEQALERVLGLCAHPDASLPVGEPLMDIQVLAPMKKGAAGRIQPQRAPSGGAEPAVAGQGGARLWRAHPARGGQGHAGAEQLQGRVDQARAKRRVHRGGGRVQRRSRHGLPHRQRREGLLHPL